MPQPSEEPKPGFIRVKYVLTYTSDVDLSAYSDMTPEEAVTYELSSDAETIIEAITGAGSGELEIMRGAKHIVE